MRIIAGSMKGRKLNTFKGNEIRPTGEKAKEAIFSMLSGYLEGSVVIDLFSGTGGLGLEALSRGAKMCYFGDNRPESIRLIRANIEICKAVDCSRVIAGSFEKTLSMIPEKADIIFLDPPYKKGLLEPCFEKIYDLNLLNEGGIIVAEHGAGEEAPDSAAGFNKIKERKYGMILVSLYG